MKRNAGLCLLIFVFLVLLSMSAFLTGCGNSNKEAVPFEQPAAPRQVGSQSCINQCHALTTDIFGEQIAATWQTTTHTTVFHVQCEDCHGAGSLHWGIGPIPFPNPPAAPCNVCHKKSGFDGTRHANANHVPDSNFSQITTTATGGRHIEECSVCHNPNQRFEFGFNDVLVKPKPNNLPTPQVACAACHWGGHQPVDVTTTVPQRGNADVFFPLFRPFTVDPGTFAQSPTGTVETLSTFQPNGAVKPDGSVDFSSVTGTNNAQNNELHVERVCAACHTKGTYKNSGGATHQEDVFGEWTVSAHGERNAPAFAEFSAMPTAYINPNLGSFYTDTSHRTAYPFDMATSGSTTFTTAGSVNATHNAAGNFACFKCHSGLGSLAHQEDIQGTAAAPVIFGDEPVFCVTCHDPHTNVPGQTKNTRKPKIMLRYISSSGTFSTTGGFSGNVFLDNTPVPGTTGNATICVFCHQGRESGFTLFKSKLFSDATTTNQSFFNPHYLGTGAMLWARNGYEFSQVTGTPFNSPSTTSMHYGMVTQHQQKNCTGCHMAPPVSTADGTVGGHTWKIVSDNDLFVNNATCNTSACHSGQVPSTNAGGEFDNFRDTAIDPSHDYDGNLLIEGIPVEVMGLENQVIALLSLYNIEYDDTAYPYFFKKGLAHTNANAFKAWNLATFKAAFNLSFVIKGLPSGPTQINEPNPSAATHNYRYNIQLLHDSYENLYNNFVLLNGVAPITLNPVSVPVPNATNIQVTLVAPTAMFRPSSQNDRPATNYDPQPGGAYNVRQ